MALIRPSWSTRRLISSECQPPPSPSLAYPILSLSSLFSLSFSLRFPPPPHPLFFLSLAKISPVNSNSSGQSVNWADLREEAVAVKPSQGIIRRWRPDESLALLILRWPAAGVRMEGQDREEREERRHRHREKSAERNTTAVPAPRASRVKDACAWAVGHGRCSDVHRVLT